MPWQKKAEDWHAITCLAPTADYTSPGKPQAKQLSRFTTIVSNNTNGKHSENDTSRRLRGIAFAGPASTQGWQADWAAQQQNARAAGLPTADAVQLGGAVRGPHIQKLLLKPSHSPARANPLSYRVIDVIREVRDRAAPPRPSAFAEPFRSVSPLRTPHAFQRLGPARRTADK